MHLLIGRGLLLDSKTYIEFGQTQEQVRALMGSPVSVRDEVGDGSEESWEYSNLRLDFDLSYPTPRLINLELPGQAVSAIEGRPVTARTRAELVPILDELAKERSGTTSTTAEIDAMCDEIELSYHDQLSLIAWFDRGTDRLSSISFGHLFADSETPIFPESETRDGSVKGS